MTTDSAHTLPVADNLLQQEFAAAAPDRVWLTDITYIATDEGWLYLAGIKDLCTREIVWTSDGGCWRCWRGCWPCSSVSTSVAS